MSNMIAELTAAGDVLTDEEQVQAVIRSLPRKGWDHMKVNLTHNDSIKTFDDVSRHIELEEDRLEADKPEGEAFMVDGEEHKASGAKRKRGAPYAPKNGKKHAPTTKKPNNGDPKRKRGTRGGKKDKSKMTCHNCQKLGLFARECTEPKTQQQQST